MQLEAVLKNKFSYNRFRPGQKEIIQSVLEKNDTLAILSTGTGKSLCYQLPGYLMEGSVLIISPLLSLMQDQVEQLKARGEKRAVAINSFLTFDEKRFVLRNMRRYKFIYISPEMVQNEEVLNALKSINISLLVVDEAHCISQWGYDFRPDYLEIGSLRDILGRPVTLALTATARKEVQEDIKRLLKIEDGKEFIFSTDRPNIAYAVSHVKDYEEKGKQLIEYVKTLQGPGIIYFTSKKLADEWAAYFNENHIGRAASYHAGVEQEQRIILQQQFLYNEITIMCATSAFGMGVNKGDIRYIIHFHPPADIESYMQQVGRAGRDGNKSIAILLYCPDDIHIQTQLMESDLPNPYQINYFSQYMRQLSELNGHLRDHRKQEPLEGFSETQWRILWKYYLNSSQPEMFSKSMAEFVERRLKWKSEKLNEMTEWIFKQGCRREHLLKLFEESKDYENEACCDQCGLDMSKYMKAEDKPAAIIELNWRKRLSEIFGYSRGE